MTQSARLHAALRYVARGWSVVPLHTPVDRGCSCRRGKECPSPGKHPRTRNGVKDASTDPDQIQSWWKRWPNANIGVACGAMSRLIVLDVDPRNGGSVANIIDRHGPLPETLQSQSGGGGTHLLFHAENCRSCACDCEGVDVLGDGKLFVAPPSLHASGKTYGWKPENGPDDSGGPSLAAAPPWLTALCSRDDSRSPKPETPAPAKCAPESTPAVERVRIATAAMLRCRVHADENDGSKRLFVYACRAVEFDLTDADAIRAIRAAGQAASFPREWTDGEIVERVRAAERKTQRGKKLGGSKGQGGKRDRERSSSHADVLVDLVSRVELWHTPGNDGVAYASVPVGERIDHVPTRSKAFRRWLSHKFYSQFSKSAPAQSLQDAVCTIEGRAMFEGATHQAFVRLAECDGAIWLDLANDEGQTVRIDRNGWVVENSKSTPVRFIRRRGTLALPVPVRCDEITLLRRFVNLADDSQWALLTTWLIAALRPRGPYPVLVLNGEQGSAKSTLCRVVRRLVDPNTAPLRRPPREDRDLMIAASNSWIVCFDNMSGIALGLSDSLCALATGGGFSTRELYSDDDERIFDAMRPVMVNGIEDLATRGDLADRSVVLALRPIDDAARQREDEFWREFDEVRSAVLGGLLHALSEALRRLPELEFSRLPRMADYAAIAIAAEPALGLPPGAFMEAYTDNRHSATASTIEGSPVGAAIVGLMHARDGHPWVGTAQELLTEIETRHSDSKSRERSSWPRTSRALASAVRRLAPDLRRMGITHTPPNPKDKRRRHTLENSREHPPIPPDRPETGEAERQTATEPGRLESADRPDCDDIPPRQNLDSSLPVPHSGGMGDVGGQIPRQIPDQWKNCDEAQDDDLFLGDGSTPMGSRSDPIRAFRA